MTKKTLINIDTNLLQDYKQIEKLNPNNWDILSYLNLKYDLNAAIAFSKIFFPDFIEKENCILLGFLYDEEVFMEWHKRFNGDIPAIEGMCNSYDVMDFFALNKQLDQSSDFYNKLIDEFAEILKKSWEINCERLFPERNMIVEVYEEYDTTRISLFTKF